MTTDTTTSGGGQAGDGTGDPAADGTTTDQQNADQQQNGTTGTQSDSDAGNGTDTGAGANGDAKPPGDDSALGDAGKKALKAERDARAAADKRAREAEQQLEQLRRAQMDDNERALDDAKREGKAAGAKMLARGAVIAAATKAGFADPEDAVVALGDELAGYVDLATEQVDQDAIESDLSELLTRKPHWKAGPPPPSTGGADHQGDAGTGSTLAPEEQWNQHIRAAAAR